VIACLATGTRGRTYLVLSSHRHGQPTLNPNNLGMALRTQKPSKHNQMLGKWIQKAKPKPAGDEQGRPSKRSRLDDTPSDSESILQSPQLVATAVDSEGDDEETEPLQPVYKTDLESALPAISTDAEAIEEYEAFKASQNDDYETSAEGRFKDRNWLKGKSSIYVDAFNLALDTVLDEEEHLFDKAEMEVFKQWRNLGYEDQYLYVA